MFVRLPKPHPSHHPWPHFCCPPSIGATAGKIALVYSINADEDSPEGNELILGIESEGGGVVGDSTIVPFGAAVMLAQ